MSQSFVEDEKAKFFCYTFIKTISESVIGFVLLAATFGLLVLALILYKRASKVNMVGGSVKYIYITLFLWATIYIFKIVIAELIYWIQYSRPQDNTPEVDKNYSYATKYLFGIDLIGVFLIQMILILVCYIWMSNIIGIFQQLLQMDDDKAAQMKSYLKFESVCKTLLKMYLRARFIFFGILIAFIAIPDRDTENILLQTILILLIFEAFLVLIIFSLSMHAIRKNNKLAELVNDGQIQDMIKKYVILTLCALTRCIVDSIFVYYNFFTLTNKQTCYVNPNQSSTVMSLLYITFQGFFTHCLPIFVVLRIYRVEQSNIDLTESLLAAEQYTGSTDNPNGTN